ncbi:uncharacterized protein SPAPADRAFT_62958 [Spathaspora passalidarum NRRL Y-27907]|uniref:Uncharacterized protein n=1 Tax=Spathaspora passalidarum (strain NRRL Y-27907 / 11-Y1) TaxID=619300 RepID=G3ASD8_SPAPN|nr:uncharacterized protein SPAPADRAFT_62958 [Spathaspora passalidarum NRRL Y-27907]EGW31056.1 hypothetical protein SPAPADRAFT_62958 [Spathaspora passalidarum NRRL Y-27907]
MSQKLADACDSLLEYTSLLQHSSDIPKIASSKSNDLDKTQKLQQEYYTLYKQLNHKLSRLIYLNKLKELDSDSIPTQLDNIKTQFDIQDNEELLQFLTNQNTQIKINKLFNRYLLMTLPILKSIHYSNLTESETKILDDLQKLYDLDSGISLKLVKQAQTSNNDRDAYFDKVNELQNLITNEIKPMLVESTWVNSQLEEVNKKYVNLKEDTIDEKASRVQVLQLVEQWDNLKKLSSLIPLLISSLPTNWYTDESLVSVMNECDDISQRIAKLTSVLNRETVGYYTTKQLHAFEFNEID